MADDFNDNNGNNSNENKDSNIFNDSIDNSASTPDVSQVRKDSVVDDLSDDDSPSDNVHSSQIPNDIEQRIDDTNQQQPSNYSVGQSSFSEAPSFSYTPADRYAETQKSISTTAKRIAELNALKTEELVDAKRQYDEAVCKINNIAEETKAAAEHKRAVELKNAKDEFEVALLNSERKFS